MISPLQPQTIPKMYTRKMTIEMIIQLHPEEQEVYSRIIQRRAFPNREDHLINFRLLAVQRLKTYFKENSSLSIAL